MVVETVLAEDTRKRSSERKFRFVDQNDQSREAATMYQSLVRSHVMTGIRREQRSKFKLDQTGSGIRSAFQISKDEEVQTSWKESNQKLTKRPKSPSRQDRTNDSSYASQESQSSTRSSAARFEAGGERDPITAFDETINAVQSFPQLQEISRPSILGKSRIDPFQFLPIPADDDVHQLLDHCGPPRIENVFHFRCSRNHGLIWDIDTTTIPLLMYGTRTRKPVQHQLYHVAAQDPAAFHAMLAYSARQLDSMGATDTAKRALVHSSRTLQLVHDRIRKSTFECEDGLVMAVALLAFAERRFGNFLIARQHWSALVQILKSRGGMEGLKINRWLAATIYWNCLVWSGTIDRDVDMTMDWPSITASNDVPTESWASGELTSFIANLARSKSRLLSHINSGCKSPCEYNCARRKGVFAPNGPLYKIVHPTRLATDNNNSQQAAANAQRTAKICQLPCLLYLNIITIEYEGIPSLLEQYLGKLMICIYEHSLDMDVSAEHLLIQLLIGLEDSRTECSRRSNQTVRLASAIWKLGSEARYRVESALLETLVYP